MNISKINEGYFGFYVTIITMSGNKIQGTILSSNEVPNSLKLKTEDGIILVNTDAIESIC
jgi:hypothetical protein